MRRNFKSLLVLFALIVSLFLTVSRKSPYTAKSVIEVESSRAAPNQSAAGKHYDLAALRIFNASLMRINDAYVDPTRVDPKQMLLAALDQVQKSVAEVLVEPHPEKNKVLVRVDTAQKEFSIAEVDSPWTLSLKMREIFRFVEANIQPGTDGKDLEYAATNGMLSTLDPHSVLLEPALYNEMRLNTRGQFGGLGIVIGIRNGLLTVLKPMAGTPAGNAGIKAGDHIVRIDKESTVNMMLNDAVNRLRGEPNTQVDVWIERNTQPVKKYTLTRAVIQVKTIEAHYLKNNIGYVRLSQFSGNSADDMRKALDDMKTKGGLKGIILDLRGDPGGLLDQAIKVADEFVESGTIVTTVGYANKQREEKRAQPGNQPHVPMAVLVDGLSASASEIVAGALKNLDRAVVIGNRTFGKGSVQVLYDNDDGSALKLTIAQYLTPGDVSIQSVGIMPDVAVEQASIEKERVSLFRAGHGLREQDLDAHLTSRNTRSEDKPVETLRYLADAKKKKEKDKASALLRDDTKASGDDPEEDAEPEEEPILDGDQFTEDYEIIFARDLLAQAKGWHRHEVLTSSRAFFDRKTVEEQQKIADAMKKLGVDWSPAEPTQTVQPLAAQLTTDKAGNEVHAGDTVTLKATVTNKGNAPMAQVRAITKCDDPLLDDREFLIGKIQPGESRTWTVPVKVDRAALSRLDKVKLELSDGKSSVAADRPVDRIDLKIDGLPRPRFAYSYQLIDDIKGNGDGLIERGEEARLQITVRNIGEGKAYQTLATLSNKSGDGVDVGKGRFKLDNLQPGESKTVDFTFSVGDYHDDTFSLQMDVYDQTLHEYVTDKLTFPVIGEARASTAANGSVTVTADKAEVRAGAATAAAVIGTAPRGASFKVTGHVGDFYRVEVEANRPGFVLASSVSAPAPGKSAKPGSFVPSMQVMPPRLAVENAPLSVDGATFKLSATATDEHQVADGFVFVTNRTAKIDHRKVYYHSNRKGQTPKSLHFDAQIPLWPGANQVTLVARQSNQVQSQQTLIVQRQELTPTQQTAAK